MSNFNIADKVDKSKFDRDGILVIPGFYDLQKQILPIQQQIHTLIRLLADKHGVPGERKDFAPETFDFEFQALIRHNRKLGSIIYDAVKQIPEFVTLVASPQHVNLFKHLRPGSMPAVAAGGYGLRIDNPGEERFRAPWHQDYSAQFRSIDGLVFWSPLVQMVPELGPVEFLVGSHKDGVHKMYAHDASNPEKSGAYALRIVEEPALLEKFPRVSPLLSPGDLVVIDYLNVHQSGVNSGKRSRWSMQMRMFNFLDPHGIEIGWHGGFATGVSAQQFAPHLFVASPN